VARPSGDDAIRLFGDYQRRRNLSPKTIRARRFRLIDLSRWLDKDLLDVTTDELEKWLDRHQLAPQTRYTYITHLAAFYGWCFKQRWIKRDPVEDMVKPRLPKRVPRPMEAHDLEIALEQADPRMRAFLLLTVLGGFRCMEIAGLMVEDIRREQNVILVHGKGNKERLVPLHPLVMDALIQYGLPRCGYVFRRPDGKPLLASTVSTYITKHMKSLGLSSTAHQGRHRYATTLYALSGGDLRLVQDLLGHQSPASTAGYAAWAPERAAVVVEQLTLPGT
jgi:integrase/recombinase XerC